MCLGLILFDGVQGPLLLLKRTDICAATKWWASAWAMGLEPTNPTLLNMVALAWVNDRYTRYVAALRI
jgi:hypothetical protein